MMGPVLITGTSSGIGRGLLQHYHGAGREVIAVSRRVLPRDAAMFPGARFVACDVRDRQSVHAFFADAAATGRLPELLFLNAGINKVDSQDTFSLDTFQEVMSVNLDGALNFVDAALPHLLGRKATFVTSSSTANIYPNPNSLGYYISKLAAHRIFQMLDHRYQRHGIRFKSVILGPVATPLLSAGVLSSRFQACIRDFVTVTVDDVVPRIARFVDSRGQSFCYSKRAMLVFRLASIVGKMFPSLYRGAVPETTETESRATSEDPKSSGNNFVRAHVIRVLDKQGIEE